MSVVVERYFPCIKVAVKDLKKVVDAYKTLGCVGVIDFSESGMLSGYINVSFSDYRIFDALYKDSVKFSLNGFTTFACVDFAFDETASNTKEEDVVASLKATTMQMCELITNARRKGFNVEVSTDTHVSQRGVHPVFVKITKIIEY